jgi:hypothetical protein
MILGGSWVGELVQSIARYRLTSDNSLLSEPKSDDRPVQVTHAGLPLHSLSGLVLDYLCARVRTSTRRAYQSDLLHFVRWGGAIPYSAETVAEYLAIYAEALSIATLVHRLVAISKAHASKVRPKGNRDGVS